MDVVEALVRCGGVARTADLLRSVPRYELRRAVEQGRVVRAAHGRYRLPECDVHAEAAGRLGGASSLLSAALAHGWPVKLPPELPQVVVPRGRNVGSRRAGVDLVDRARRVVVEADSFEFHADSASSARDMERYNGFVAEDHQVLRFAWRHAMFAQDYVRAVVSSVVSPNRRSRHACPTCAAA